jgi:hypothetical protein
MKILGISAHYHDSAAALVVDGVPVAAVQEERLSRRKNDAAFPLGAIEWCLEHAGLEPDALDAVVFYERRCSSSSASSPGAACLSALVERLPARDEERARREDVGARIIASHLGVPARRSCSPSIISRTPRLRSSPRRRDAPRSLTRWRRGMGDAIVGTASASRQRDGDPPRRERSASRTRSACCTRRSPPTSGSRSTRANTR